MTTSQSEDHVLEGMYKETEDLIGQTRGDEYRNWIDWNTIIGGGRDGNILFHQHYKPM